MQNRESFSLISGFLILIHSEMGKAILSRFWICELNLSLSSFNDRNQWRFPGYLIGEIIYPQKSEGTN